MRKNMIQIEQKIKELPPELQHEVEDFIDFVTNTRHLSFRKNRCIGGEIDQCI